MTVSNCLYQVQAAAWLPEQVKNLPGSHLELERIILSVGSENYNFLTHNNSVTSLWALVVSKVNQHKIIEDHYIFNNDIFSNPKLM